MDIYTDVFYRLSQTNKRTLLYSAVAIVSAITLFFAYINPLRAEADRLRQILPTKGVQASEMRIAVSKVKKLRGDTEIQDEISALLDNGLLRKLLLANNMRGVTVQSVSGRKTSVTIKQVSIEDFWGWYTSFRTTTTFSVESFKLIALKDASYMVSIELLINNK